MAMTSADRNCKVCTGPLNKNGICSVSASHVQMAELVDHPAHYGGSEDPFEHIKVAEAKGWGYHIGNCTKYLWRAGLKGKDVLEDLRKARWYLDRYIRLLEQNEKTECHVCHEALFSGQVIEFTSDRRPVHQQCAAKATMMREKR